MHAAIVDSRKLVDQFLGFRSPPLTSIARPDRLLYGSDYAWTCRDHALHLLTSLDVAFGGCNAGWRARSTHNADILLAQEK